MSTIIVEFDESDVELRNALADAFGDQVTMVETRSFDGGVANVVQAIVPAVSALAPILVAYFARPKTTPTTKRVVIADGGGITMEGYSADEVERVIQRARSGDSK